MKKELKELIKTKKLSDDQILKILTKSFEPAESEADIKDEADESEDQSDSEETEQAESTPAQKEKSKPQIVNLKDMTKLIADSVAEALKKREDESKYPAQKPIKKDPPKAKQKEDIPLETQTFQLVG